MNHKKKKNAESAQLCPYYRDKNTTKDLYKVWYIAYNYCLNEYQALLNFNDAFIGVAAGE